MFDWVLNTPLGIFRRSWTKMFAIAIMAKSWNWLTCQNGLCSRGMQVRYFLLNILKYFNMEVRERTNNVKHEYVNVHCSFRYRGLGTGVNAKKARKNKYAVSCTYRQSKHNFASICFFSFKIKQKSKNAKGALVYMEPLYSGHLRDRSFCPL